MDEILGEFDSEEEDRGKKMYLRTADSKHDADRIHELEDEVDELKERLERERKRSNDLATTNKALMEDKRNTTTEDKFGGLANYLASYRMFKRKTGGNTDWSCQRPFGEV